MDSEFILYHFRVFLVSIYPDTDKLITSGECQLENNSTTITQLINHVESIIPETNILNRFIDYYHYTYLDKIAYKMIGRRLTPKLFTIEAISKLIYSSGELESVNDLIHGLPMFHILSRMLTHSDMLGPIAKKHVHDTISPLIEHLIIHSRSVHQN